MNIAMLSIHSCPIGELGAKDTGGMSVYIRELAKELGKKGHCIDIYTRYHGPKHKRVMALSENVRLLHVKAGDNGDMNKLAIYPHVKDFAVALDEIKQGDGVEYDLIHSHYWLSGLVGRIVQQWWNVPHMIMFHTLGAIKNKINIGVPEPDFRICNETALVQSCHKIVAATIKEKHDFIQHYNAVPETISVVPCGVNQDLFQPMDRKIAREHLGLGINDKIILYVGRVEPLKGLGRLIQTVSHLKNQVAAKLIIAGGDDLDQPEMKQVTGLVRQLGVEDLVTFAGRVDQINLPYYYNAADALVIASLYESFGLVALEALSCGTPVVSTAVGGMKTVVRPGETGYLVSDDTVKSMGKCIYDILSNPEFYQARSLTIRNSISRFSWSNIAKALIEEYRSLLSDNSQGCRSTQPTEVFNLRRASCG